MWQGTQSSDETYAWETNANQYTIVHRPAGPFTDPDLIPTDNNAGPNILLFFDTEPGLGGNDMKGLPCPAGVGAPPSIVNVGTTKDALKKALADTSTANPYFEEMRWSTELSAYKMLLENDSLTLNDSLLTAFHDSCFSANLGKLVRASNGLSSGKDEVKFLDTLNNMSTSIVPEDAWRDVLVVGLNAALDTASTVDSTYLAVDSLMRIIFPDSVFPQQTIRKVNWDSTQTSVLETIALECPYEYGVAVFVARSLMSDIYSQNNAYHSSCEDYVPPSSREAGASEEADVDQQSEVTALKVYPNPTRNRLTVELLLEAEEYATFRMIDRLGRVVLYQQIVSGSNSIDLNGVSSGLYQYSVIVNGHIRMNGKQVISK